MHKFNYDNSVAALFISNNLNVIIESLDNC